MSNDLVSMRAVTLYMELKSKQLYQVLSSVIHFADTNKSRNVHHKLEWTTRILQTHSLLFYMPHLQ